MRMFAGFSANIKKYSCSTFSRRNSQTCYVLGVSLPALRAELVSRVEVGEVDL